MSGPSPPRMVDLDETDQTQADAIEREAQERVKAMAGETERLRTERSRVKSGNAFLRAEPRMGL